MKRNDGYKQTGQITPVENERMLQLHTELSGRLFRARELHDMFSIAPVQLQRYLWIGRDIGLFAFAVPSVGNQAAVYRTLDVNAAEILDNITRKTEIRRTVEMKHVDTDCMLANIMGLRPIEHDCNPRVIAEKKVLRATRGRDKVYVSGGWMEGL